MTEEALRQQDANAPPLMSRRDFIKQAGAGFVAVAAIGVGGANLLREPVPTCVGRTCRGPTWLRQTCARPAYARPI